ncbi:hypothetical protein [Massilia aquatica]|uniref:Uncharacterized protein n=1 Tax=Massilia aquatica TaxID=2609000 RepID=A0ABX0M8K4_9BURK|nr:hypothetical protein [Massilia aquatica]NHZ40747.1 hypothetical protein [Massilia aquatica]
MSNTSTRVPPKAKTDARKPLAAGAQMLADAVATFPDQALSNDQQRRTWFTPAYQKIARAVPQEKRLAIFREMKKELSDLIASLQAGRPTAANDASEGRLLMEELRRQERVRRMADVKAGRLISSSTLRERLGISAQALGAAVRTKRIFSVKGPQGERLFPAFFADPKYARRDLEKISMALGDLPGSIKFAFFTTQKISLGNKRPLDVTQTRMNRILTLAQGLVEE